MLRRIDQCLRGHEAHDLGARDRHAVSCRLVADGLGDPEQRRLREVGHVHRDLRDLPAANLDDQAHRFHETIAAGTVTDSLRDLLRDLDVVGVEIHVVGDERHARTHDHGAE